MLGSPHSRVEAFTPFAAFPSGAAAQTQPPQGRAPRGAEPSLCSPKTVRAKCSMEHARRRELWR